MLVIRYHYLDLGKKGRGKVRIINTHRLLGDAGGKGEVPDIGYLDIYSSSGRRGGVESGAQVDG